jgi:hypothetical protein
VGISGDEVLLKQQGIEMPFDLISLRRESGLSESQMGARIGCPEERILLYEKEPARAPFEVVLKYIHVSGRDVSSILNLIAQQSTAPVDQSTPIDPGKPYQDLDHRMRLLLEYVAAVYPESPGTQVPGVPDADEILKRLGGLWRRPNVVLTGPFDVGKSRLSNCLLSTDRIPSRYRPATRVTTYIRHAEECPEWQKEDVWILDKDYDPTRWRDQAHCLEHRVRTGGFDLLELPDENAPFALVYLDAPILRACTLIDLPGFDDKDQDEQRTLAAARSADVLLYLSTAVGFLRQQDLMHLGQLVRALPALPITEGKSPIPNFFVVATHAHREMKNSDLNKILDDGARLVFEDLQETWVRKGSQIGYVITKEDIRKQFFAFWYEAPDRRRPLELALQDVVADVLPPFINTGVAQQIKELKERSSQKLGEQVRLL